VAKPRPAANKANKSSKAAAGGGGAAKGRVGQVKQLRDAQKKTAPTRKDAREQTLSARRGVRDQRRAERQNKPGTAKNGSGLNVGKKNPGASGGRAGTATGGKTSPGGGSVKKNPARATLAKRMKNAVQAKARNAINQADHKARATRDQAAQTRADRIAKTRRNAKAAAKLTRQKAAAHARYAAKAVGAGLLAAPVGLLGCLTTPLGRRLGWPWLMYPGRRLYAWLMRRARHERDTRIADAKNTYAYDTNPDSDDQNAPVADAVPRGPRRTTRTTLTGEPDMSEVLKFLFDESAADMEAAAQAYEPGGMIHVYQTVQGMPAGIQSWANTFKILAEKSDDSFPLEPSVGEALSEVFEHLQKAAAAAEEVRTVFEREHAHDLERLQSPRKSLEAEKTWDASANEDYL
jgi:hypothetical protein